MGSPELPDPGEEDLRPTVPIQQPGPIISDESDNESEDAYNGYQPLAIDENTEEANTLELGHPINEPVTTQESNQNLPTIVSAEVEIESQVWSAPRPQENQIELDTTRTAQILSAMANFTLPNATIPEWAVDVPEERWKEELLQRIRHRKDIQQNEDDNTPNKSN